MRSVAKTSSTQRTRRSARFMRGSTSRRAVDARPAYSMSVSIYCPTVRRASSSAPISRWRRTASSRSDRCRPAQPLQSGSRTSLGRFTFSPTIAMKIGMITDSLPDTDFEAMLDVAARLGMDMLEFGCGNWSTAPHLQLDRLLDHDAARRELRARLADHDIEISALNCSGNPLHPGEPGRRHDDVTRKTIRLARLLDVERVVMMSGCPGAPGDRHANWITTEWPPEVRDILRWQWDEVLIPYWRDLVAYANGLGIHKLCLELHGHQNVYNVRTLHKLRDIVGPTVGANLDPSHLMWMGADAIVAVRALGDAIFHVHAKDTRIDPVVAAINGMIETTPGDR